MIQIIQTQKKTLNISLCGKQVREPMFENLDEVELQFIVNFSVPGW